MDKNKKLMSIVIGLFVVVIIMLSIFLYFFMTNSINNEGMQSKNDDPKYLINVSLTDSIRTNLLKDYTNTNHNVQIKIGYTINTKNEKKNSKILLENMKKDEDVIRDLIITSIRKKTYDQLNAEDGHQRITAEIKNQLSSKYNTNLIVDVFMSDFIVT